MTLSIPRHGVLLLGLDLRVVLGFGQLSCSFCRVLTGDGSTCLRCVDDLILNYRGDGEFRSRILEFPPKTCFVGDITDMDRIN